MLQSAFNRRVETIVFRSEFFALVTELILEIGFDITWFLNHETMLVGT